MYGLGKILNITVDCPFCFLFSFSLFLEGTERNEGGRRGTGERGRDGGGRRRA